MELSKVAWTVVYLAVLMVVTREKQMVENLVELLVVQMVVS